MSLNVCVDLVFGRAILNHALQDRLLKEITTKHNIQKTHIHSFHNKLLAELTAIRELFLTLTLTKNLV